MATFSVAVRASERWNCWNTNPSLLPRSADRLRSGSDETSWPSISTVPDDGRSRVPIRCSRVDLPEPDGPTIASNSPALTCSETSANAVTPPG
ncbi:hypothetical protein GCM10010178_00770 [Lentzea flava]|uniref:Uncharacterized protein n=1 Tax=Lentzea flava TaxID=103732 RepID=A0ABQ2U9D9_9PSEU|nr:hypothetical protein [Lentzea flava]GGU13424.1 hypothetical protein GCM10010178_00770 [Lentzea flava]